MCIRDRIQVNGSLERIEDVLESSKANGKKIKLKNKVEKFAASKIRILIDRFVVKHEDEENKKRIADSAQTAFYESEGDCIVEVIDKKELAFNSRFELDGMAFLEPSPQLFNYNNSFGACPKCEGYGKVMGIDEKKVVPFDNKSVYDGAIACLLYTSDAADE